MRDTANNPAAVRQWKNQFADIESENSRLSRQAGNNTTIGVKSSDGPVTIESNTVLDSAERDALQLQLKRAQEDAEGRTEIMGEWDEANRLASDYADLMYAAKGGEDVGVNRYLVDFVDDTIKKHSTSFPEAGTYDQLMAQTPGAADVLARLNLSTDDIRKIRNRELTVDEALAGKNLSREKVEETINLVFQQQTNIVAVTLNMAQKKDKTPRDQKVASLKEAIQKRDEALADKVDKSDAQIKQLQEQRDELDAEKVKLELEEHAEISNTARAYNSATTSVATLLLGDSEEIQDVSTAVNAGIDLYESVGAMIITGALDPTGIATAANAINMVSSVFGRKKSDPNVKLLRQILANQKIMLEKLTSIETKVDVLLEKTNEIIGKLDAMRIQIDQGFTQTLETVNAIDRKALLRDQTFAQQALIRDEEGLIGDALKPFREKTGFPYESAVECIIDKKCNASAAEQFNKIYGTSGTLRAHAVRSLREDDAFVKIEDFRSSDLSALREDHSKQPEQMLGKLSSMAVWINEDIASSGGSNNAPLNTGIYKRVPHPYYLTNFYIPQYVDLVTHLPENYKATGETPDGRDLIRALDDVKRPAIEARRAVPLAIDIYKARYKTMLDAVNEYIAIPMNDPTERQGEYFNLSNILAQDPVLKDMFLTASDVEIRMHFESMGSMQFAEFGERMGVFTIQRNYEYLDARKPGYNGYIEAAFKYIQLTPKAQAIFGGALSASYLDAGNQAHVVYHEVTSAKRLSETRWIDTTPPRQDTYDITPTGPTMVEPVPDAAKRKPLIDIFVNEIVAKRVSIGTTWQTYVIKEAKLYDSIRIDGIRSSLAATTFINAGYGNCVDYMPELEPLRAIKRSLMDETQMEAMRGTLNLPTLYKAMMDARERIAVLPDIPDISENAHGCSLGWGDLPKAGKAILKLRRHSAGYMPGSP